MKAQEGDETYAMLAEDCADDEYSEALELTTNVTGLGRTPDGISMLCDLLVASSPFRASQEEQKVKANVRLAQEREKASVLEASPAQNPGLSGPRAPRRPRAPYPPRLSGEPQSFGSRPSGRGRGPGKGNRPKVALATGKLDPAEGASTEGQVYMVVHRDLDHNSSAALPASLV